MTTMKKMIRNINIVALSMLLVCSGSAREDDPGASKHGSSKIHNAVHKVHDRFINGAKILGVLDATNTLFDVFEYGVIDFKHDPFYILHTVQDILQAYSFSQIGRKTHRVQKGTNHHDLVLIGLNTVWYAYLMKEYVGYNSFLSRYNQSYKTDAEPVKYRDIEFYHYHENWRDSDLTGSTKASVTYEDSHTHTITRSTRNPTDLLTDDFYYDATLAFIALNDVLINDISDFIDPNTQSKIARAAFWGTSLSLFAINIFDRLENNHYVVDYVSYIQ